MAKTGLKENIKDLTQKAGVILSETERVKRNADIMLQMLKQQEAVFARQEEEERQRQRYETQQQIFQQQAKAWTMPDEEERAILEASAKEVEAAAQVAAASATAQSLTEAIASETVPLEHPAPQGAPAQPSKAEEPAAPATVAQPAAAQQAEPAGAAEPKETVTTAQAAQAAQTPRTASAAQAAPEQEAQPLQAPRAQQTAQEPQTARPVHAPESPRIARAVPQTPRPGVPIAPRPQPRPGVFAPPAPQGQTAPRPAAPYARPAGPYGRPAPGSPQYGQAPVAGARPAGPYGRPAPGSPQFGQPRPAGAPPFGRPAMGGMPGQRPMGPGLGRPPFPGRPGMGRLGAKPAAEELPTLEKDRVSTYDPNKKSYIRKPDPEHVSKQRKQSVRKSQPVFMGHDEETVRGRRPRLKRPSAQQLMAPIRIEQAFMTADKITVKDLTERVGKPAGEILKKLLLLGNMATINSELDFDTAALVSADFGVELIMKQDRTAEEQMIEVAGVADAEESLVPRPPVITIMGHVDHGKTSLLDYIRSTHVVRGEAGGITQHIGAYSVVLDDHAITFLDTPGHEAFTAMRARGAQATDIAVLVVAADDGVMPQTIEAINHAHAAKVPVIVAINKMDKPEANPERIKQDLTAYNLVSEDWGGDTIMVEVSAKTGDGVDRLLEMILLQAEVLQLRANPERLGRGIIIEAKLDKNRGALATVLIKNGTLRVGDNIIAGMASGRVRALLNDRGDSVREAGPSMPVEISGFSAVPQAGDELMVVEDDKLVRQVAKEREDKIREQRVLTSSAVTLDNLYQSIKDGEQLTFNVIIKGDVQGSVEAVRQSLEKLSTEKVKIHIMHAGVGAVTKDDVNLAATGNATIIAFNISPDANARAVAAKEGVDIRQYRIIYQAIEDIEKAMKGLLKPEFREVILGHAEVRNVFHITGAGTIAGCYVLDGKMQRNQPVRLLRDAVPVFEGKLSSLRRFKDDVKEVAAGFECGIGLENFNDVKEKDVIECFMNEEIER